MKSWENKSGCKDPTAYAATKAVDGQITENQRRLTDAIHIMKSAARLAGFEIVGRIHLRDITTGRDYR